MQNTTNSLLNSVGSVYLLADQGTPTIVDYLPKRTLEQLLRNSTDCWQMCGISSGDTVALLSHNHLLYLPLLLSAIKNGITIVPVNWHLADSEIQFVLSDSQAKLLITDQDNLADLTQIPCVSIDAFFKEALDIKSENNHHSNDITLNSSIGNIMLYTSGTTGKPKGVIRAGAKSWPEQISQWCLLGDNLGLKGQGRHLVTGPLYHAAPLFFALFDWLNGAEIYLMPSWSASGCLNALHELQITHTHCVPTMFNGLLKEPQRPLPFLQCVLHGAGPISRQTKQRMLNWWGDCLLEYWGGSESGTLTIATTQQWQQYPGTVGKPLAGYEVFAVDDEGGRLPPNKEGLLFAKKPIQTNRRAFEYFNDKQKTDAAFNKEGAFTLGDAGYVNEDGFIFLANRRGDLIISGGANIYPAEIEQALCNITEVDDAAVFPINDDYWGQRPWALIVLNKSADIDGHYLKQQLKTTLAGYKIPDGFIFTDSIPRSDAGKLYRRYLTEQYQQQITATT